jgi:hypothetical protein
MSSNTLRGFARIVLGMEKVSEDLAKSSKAVFLAGKADTEKIDAAALAVKSVETELAGLASSAFARHSAGKDLSDYVSFLEVQNLVGEELSKKSPVLQKRLKDAIASRDSLADGPLQAVVDHLLIAYGDKTRKPRESHKRSFGGVGSVWFCRRPKSGVALLYRDATIYTPGKDNWTRLGNLKLSQESHFQVAAVIMTVAKGKGKTPSESFGLVSEFFRQLYGGKKLIEVKVMGETFENRGGSSEVYKILDSPEGHPREYSPEVLKTMIGLDLPAVEKDTSTPYTGK